MNDEELAALIEAQSKPRQRHLHAKAIAAAVTCLVGGFGLARLGVDGHLVIRGLVLASPVMAAGLLVFLRRAWGQNFTAPPLTADLATTEPASLASDLADDVASEVGQPVASPASQPTAPVVPVLPLPAAQPTIPIPGIAVAKAGEPVYTPWRDSDGDD